MDESNRTTESSSPYDFEKSVSSKRKSLTSGAALSASAAFAILMVTAPVAQALNTTTVSPSSSQEASTSVTSTEIPTTSNNPAETMEFGVSSVESPIADEAASSFDIAASVDLVDPLAIDFGNTSSATPAAGAYGDDDEDDDEDDDDEDDDGDDDDDDDDDEDGDDD